MNISLGAPPPTDITKLFAEPVEEAWLEVGFGAGEHLIWQAENHPNVGIIGAEPYVNGVVAALSQAEARRLFGRLRLHGDDVLPLLDWLPASCIARIFMLFPDPWPKKRHRARRLFSPSFLDHVERVLRPGAEFRFASDIADYSAEAIATVQAHPAFEVTSVQTSSANSAWRTGWPITRYERKALREGRPSTFVVFRRKSSHQPSSAAKT